VVWTNLARDIVQWRAVVNMEVLDQLSYYKLLKVSPPPSEQWR
jgi:hypothetical protein